MFNTELVANAGDNEIDSIGQGLRTGVETGHSGQNDGADFGTGSQVAKLAQVQRRLARDEDEATSAARWMRFCERP